MIKGENMEYSRRLTKKKRSKKKKKILIFFLTILFLLVGSGTGYGIYLYSKIGNVMDQSYEEIDPSTQSKAAANFSKGNFSILFMGVDDSEERDFSDNARTDALMLATVDLDDQSIKLVSIPRDSYVYIPERDRNDKITHAHAYGGVSATVETVEELLDIPVDYYVKMNFQAFVEVIDTLGGVEVDVPFAFSEQNSADRANAIRIKEGIQTLDGEEALAFARTRKLDNDIERGKRQQQLVEAVVKEAASISSVTKYSSLMENIGDNMKTSLTMDELNYFITYVAKGNAISIESLAFEGEDSTIDGIYYYELHEESIINIQEELKQHLEITELAQSSVSEPNSSSADPLTEQTDDNLQ
jgi:polyisoprenyl-teichoic acid--peptidoglycan teichoic acid transferase